MEERRLHQRQRVQFEAKLTNAARPEQSALGRVSDISAMGISVTSPLQLTPGDPIELELADSVLAGRVAHSTPEDAQFRTGIEVAQVRLGSTDLSYLLQRTLIDVLPGTPGLEPSEAQFADRL